MEDDEPELDLDWLEAEIAAYEAAHQQPERGDRWRLVSLTLYEAAPALIAAVRELYRLKRIKA